MSHNTHNRLPPWLKKRVPLGGGKEVSSCLSDLKLGTVCQSARCPNQLECYSKGRATFLLMGPSCSRRCGFCAVSHAPPEPLDQTEPLRVGDAVARLKLKHAVITSVTRDDLPDGGAEHFAATVRAVRNAAPDTTIEILVPDFGGDPDAWATAVHSRPDVFNHNIETVPRLYSKVRPEADYDMSLALLDYASESSSRMLIKSGLMLGFGETADEVLSVADDLYGVGVRMITVGQYLCPDETENLPVEHFITPEDFAGLAEELRAIGFPSVACSPFVRSSYNAAEAISEI